MSIRVIAAGLLISAAILASGCVAGVAALLVYELLDDEAPVRTWTGTVTDTNTNPVGGVLVQVKAEVAGNDDVMHFSDTTAQDGTYTVKFRWHEDINYTIRVVGSESTVYYEEVIGKVPLVDREQDFVITL
jgi:hypothetical protein